MEEGVAWRGAGSVQPFPIKEAAAVAGLALLIPILRSALEPVILMPVAHQLLGLRGRERMPPKLASTAKKLCESQWKLMFYSCLTALGVWATHSQPWLWDTQQLWSGWPNQVMTTPMRLLYAAELSYYLATIMMLAVWEVPRKDYYVMMMHHFSTVALIVFTYKYNYARAGCVVMLLHDINDVLMELAKTLSYARLERASTLVFSMFMTSWVVLRIWAYPTYVIHSTLFESQQALGFRPPFHALLNCLLCVLYVFHVYWFCLIVRIACKKLTTGRLQDVRESES